MSKSVLVMNNIPNNCFEDCVLCQLNTDCSLTCFITKKDICDDVSNFYKRPDWCPLKPLPDKMTGVELDRSSEESKRKLRLLIAEITGGSNNE